MTRSILVVLLIGGLTGCAVQPSPKTAPPPSRDEPAAPAGAGPSSTVAPAAPAEPESEQLPATTSPEKKKEGEALAGTAGAVMDLFNASEVLALSSGRDCATACKALRSMNNAAEQLCSIAQDDRERERCTRARERVRAATQRVKGNCGQCAGGPSLE